MNECTICFEQIDTKKQKLSICYICGGTVHTKCYKQWKKKAGLHKPDKCLYCQRETYFYETRRSWWKILSSCCC